jgi:TolA-binding protein
MSRALLLLPLLLLARAAAGQSAEPPDAGTAGPAPTETATAGAPDGGAPVAAKPPSRLFEGMGRTDEENRLLEDLSRAIDAYEAESRAFRIEVQQLVERKYEEKRKTLASSYERVLGDLEIKERKARLDAIAQFEEFLERYPDDARYTPDVMFRLAELYFERSSDDHQLAVKDYEKKLEAMQQANEETSGMQEPQLNFAPSIALYQDLVTRFPNYRFDDAVSYLLGYCLEKQNEMEKALAAYQHLIEAHPKSRFVTEAWIRVGEHYFDLPGDENLQKAADAYERAVADRAHAKYDAALYKLGWTYYKMDRFEDAVARFLNLLDHYESRRKGDEVVGGDLREEALQYIAISFADENWGSLQKARDTFARIGGRPYEAEIYRRLGNVFYDQTKHADAITAFRWYLDLQPLAKDAPQIRQKIVQAYERERQLEEAFAEAQELGARYGEGTPWAERWKDEPEVLNSAAALAEKSLYSAALYHHQQAQQYRQDGKFDQARTGYATAAKAYATYLERFPRSKNAYEMQFYLAECLFNSLQYEASADNYEAVRDSTADTKYRADAAFTAVLARQRALDDATRQGTHPTYRPLKSSERPEGTVPQAVPLSALEQKLVAASDAFLVSQPRHERAAPIAYKAAEIFYTHDDFPEARRRFEEIIRNYPRAEVASFAANLSVETFLVARDWRGVEETAARLSANREVIDPASDLFKDLTTFKLAGRFKLAEELREKGEYEPAAKKYLELVAEEPQHEFADKALNNAAICYEKTQRFDSALKLYERIFREYPQSPLAPVSIFRVAVNAEKSYDFEKAILNYQKLVKDYPASKDRETAIFNTARLLESLQRYSESAAAFLKFVELFPNSEEAPANQFRAALIYEKQGDWKGYIRALAEFVKKFSGNSKQVQLVVEAWKRQGEAWQKLNNDKEARAAFTASAGEFDKRGLRQDTHPGAANSAAQSRFLLAEYEFREFDKLKIGGRGKALEATFAVKKKALVKVNTAYDEVIKYKSFEWSLAAFYRKGYALERFAATLIETPVPADVKRLGDEAVAAYQDLLGQQTAQLEDSAVQSYTATLTQARNMRINNEWTRKTLESLNRFRPVEYPVLKESKGMMSAEAPFPLGLVGTADGVPPPPDSVQKLGEEEP